MTPTQKPSPLDHPVDTSNIPNSEFGAGSVPAPLRLDQLPNRQWATVLSLADAGSAQDRELVLRLTEIGFVPGEAVCIMASGMPGREPLAVRLGHTTFALRCAEAALIEVMPEPGSHG